MARNAIYISCTSVLDSLQPSAMNSFPKKGCFLYNYWQQLGDPCDFLVRHIESWILFVITHLSKSSTHMCYECPWASSCLGF